MNKKPIYSDTTKIGNLAVTYCQALFEEQGWLFRRADGTNDYGIDAEIEIADSNEVTGKIFKCQIKGTESINWNKNLFSVSVKTTTWNNWKSINLPTIAFLVDLSTKDIIWGLPLASIPREDSEHVSIKFSKENNACESFSELREIVNGWLEHFPKQNILREVPYFNQLYKDELKSTIDWGDPWTGIGEELDFKTRFFYNHTLELRLSVGLTNQGIFPLDFWYIRNDGVWSSPYELFHGTFSEIMKYISPYYDEAIEKLFKRIRKVKPSFENNEIVNYFKLDPLFEKAPQNVVVVVPHRWSKDKKFHTLIEDELKKINALKVSWVEKTIS